MWWAFSSDGPDHPIVRLYFDVRAATAPRVVHVVTGVLVELGVPYRLKCPVLAEAYDRADAMVAYIPRSRREEVVERILDRWSEVGHLLDPAVPMLTCQVRPGLSWADDPGDDRSYGQSRCEILAASIGGASGMWAMLDREERIAHQIEGLRAAGLAPDRPWVSPA
jgi:hypothetical protein